jgi:hypothetical protein
MHATLHMCKPDDTCPCCIEQAGFESFRIELVDEPAHQVAPLLEGYRALLRSEINWRDLWQDLQDVPDANGTPQGVAKGTHVAACDHNGLVYLCTCAGVCVHT